MYILRSLYKKRTYICICIVCMYIYLQIDENVYIVYVQRDRKRVCAWSHVIILRDPVCVAKCCGVCCMLHQAACSLCSTCCVPSLLTHAVLPLSLLPPGPTSTTLPCPCLAAVQRQLVPLLSVSRSSALWRSAASSICAHLCECVRVCVCVCMCVYVFGCMEQTH